MTIQYKNQGVNLTDTATTSVLTCPTDATILIKQIQINNRIVTGKQLDEWRHLADKK